ncbi:MAG TPA: hypothetical protein ENI75_03505 [Mizugakiibacter sp.]|nr:hypothetical protein [Mizugakiibacter sp.]
MQSEPSLKTRALMIRYRSSWQLSPAEFGEPFQTVLDGDTRWLRMSRGLPWDELDPIKTRRPGFRRTLTGNISSGCRASA